MTGQDAAATMGLRRLREDDLEAAAALSRAVGWPHRLEDWHFGWRLGEGLVAQAAGRVVGTIMAWRFGAEHATLGHVIVAPEAQGQGHGRRLMMAMLDQLGATTSVKLHATAAGQPLYASLGFVPHGGGVWQHQGTASGVGLVPLAEGERLRPAGRGDAALLRRLDMAATGLDRAALLWSLLEVAEGVVLMRGEEPTGFGLLRRFGRGYVAGPVVAPDEAAARSLMAYWIGRHSGQFLRIDLVGDGKLSSWLQESGLVPVEGVIPMWRGSAPPTAGLHCFGLSSQALG
jgi:predicted N-acetyltransferase YhbS